ncbi:DUF349 domain-containing protein [Cellvibrio mixtus]|uniref:DUF349 domain-containing protein n=1 Tax=Cellvibrio mixtus TaxID=39650 RepID=UPI0005866EC3|nr:DUF349 domain-containing protein [Cellvibrio mixtus]
MKLLRKLFGAKPKVEPVKAIPLPVAEVKPPKPVITLDVVENTNDEQELLKLAIDGATSQLRQAAAEKLHTREVLEQIAKAVKTKDKNVFKIVKTKLEIFKAEDAKQAELEVTAQRICEKLERHSHLEADALFKAKLTVLQNEWATLPSLSHVSQERFNKALAACEAKITARAQAIADEEEKQTLDLQAQQLAEEALISLKELTTNIYRHAHIDDLLNANYELKIQELNNAVRLAANRQLPLDKLTREFEHRKQQTLNLIDQIKTSGTITQLNQALEQASDADLIKQAQYKLQQFTKLAKDMGDDIPEALEQAKNKINAFFAERNQTEQAAKNALREFNELVRKGLWAAEQGFVRKARAIQKELQEKREQLTNFTQELPKAIQAKVDDFEAQLIKLGDWHEFAVTPKKEALIEQMRALANNQINPEALATRIHDLQDSWKEVSKGAQQQDDDLWQQFQQASALAYAPCKEFFEAQAAEREANLIKRRELVSQLHQYLNGYDFANAVWKDVEQTLKTARAEWQNYWPVPRKAGNDLQKEFEGLMEQLFGKITHEHESNKIAKQQLIEQAEALSNSNDSRTAAEQIKLLQGQWKTIGKSWPREDHQLWQEFRKHCDAVFAKRSEAFEAAKEQRQAITTRAEEIIAQLNQLAEQSLEQINNAKEEIENLKNEFSTLDLPKEATKPAQQKFTNSLNAIAAKRDSARHQAEAQRWVDLFNILDAIRAYEVEVINSAAPENLAAQKAELENRIANISRWPAGTLSAVQQRLAKADAIQADDQAHNANLLRILTIRAEVFAGIETPESDKSLRMNYQVQQLQQGLGQRDSQFEPLLIEWIGLGGVPGEIYSPLFARFNQIRQHSMNK